MSQLSHQDWTPNNNNQKTCNMIRECRVERVVLLGSALQNSVTGSLIIVLLRPLLRGLAQDA